MDSLFEKFNNLSTEQQLKNLYNLIPKLRAQAYLKIKPDNQLKILYKMNMEKKIEMLSLLPNHNDCTFPEKEELFWN